MVFTGDALLIRGAGRTDFQQGCPHRLFQSVRSELLSLPDETKLYPAHDYRGRLMTTVGEEKQHNPRVVLFFFAHRRHQATTVIVGGIQLGFVRQAQQLAAHRLKKPVGAPLLKIRSPRPSDEQGIPRKHHPLIAKKIADTTVGMPRGR